MKILAVLTACCAMVLCYGVFLLKQDVMKLERQHSRLQHDISATQQAIHVLKAEWAYLTRPEYVRTLAAAYLDAQPLQTKHMVRLEDVAPTPTTLAAQAPTTLAVAQ